MFVKLSGQPFVGLLSLTNGAPGPANITIKSVAGALTNYTLASDERLVVTNIAVSSNDTAQPLITIDDGAGTPRVLAKYYTGSALPAALEAIAPGNCQGFAGTLLRGTANAVTAAKTVEIVIRGYITKSV